MARTFALLKSIEPLGQDDADCPREVEYFNVDGSVLLQTGKGGLPQ